jgi:phage baseplate assembly protein W
MNLDFPFRFDAHGHTAASDDDKHIRDLIEQVLFTAAGERVNRPTFGSGLLQIMFAPNDDTLATATQFVVRGALQQWLGDLIQVDDVEIESEDSTITVTVHYIVRRTQQALSAEFTTGGPLP